MSIVIGNIGIVQDKGLKDKGYEEKIMVSTFSLFSLFIIFPRGNERRGNKENGI